MIYVICIGAVIGTLVVVYACCNISGIESRKEEERWTKEEIEKYQKSNSK